MKSLIIIVVILLLSACDQTCNDQLDKMFSKMGSPEDVDVYNSSGYHNESYWYWCEGINYSFTWGSNVEGCKVSTYEFSPICSAY